MNEMKELIEEGNLFREYIEEAYHVTEGKVNEKLREEVHLILNNTTLDPEIKAVDKHIEQLTKKIEEAKLENRALKLLLKSEGESYILHPDFMKSLLT